MDSPWHRLPWTLPTALLISVAALWGLAYFMGKPTHRPVEPSPIDAQLIEQSVPTETPSPQPEPPAGVSQPKPVSQVRPHPAPVKPKVRHRPKPQPVSEVKPEPVPERPLVRPPTNPNPVAQEPKVLTTNATAPRGVSATPGAGQATAGMKTSSNSGTPAGSYAGRARLVVACMRTAEPEKFSIHCRKFRKTCGRKRLIPRRWRVFILP